MIGMNGKVTYVDSEHGLHAVRMQAVTEGRELRYERLVKRKDGSTFPAEISLKRLERGVVQVIFRDITERREQERRIARLSRIQEVQSGINSAIVRIRDRQELLNEACRIATTIASFPIAWIGLVDPATGTLEPVAAAGLDKSFLLDLARSQGRSAFAPAGVGTRSIDQGRTIVDNDILCEPDIDGVRRMAVACGCRSAIGLPLVTDGAVVGTMMFYGAEPDFFDDAEVKLLEELAGDVSFALTFIAQQEKVEFLAYYDPLTGLPNRSLFFDRLSRQIAAGEQSGNGVALILVDLNRFRLINDTLGRKAGDALLVAVARRLAEAARPDESIARVGSNRFALASPGHWADATAASDIETRCRACFERTFLIEGEELRISASAGVAVHPMHAADAESLYANAEAALRNAQADNLPVRYYGPEMNARVAESLRLENRLKRALRNDELVLWYQPKVDIATGRLQGFEALMRWNDPETGLVPPGKFIPLMEQTGLILDAGRWALARVAEDCRRWAQAGNGPLRIAVNVSPLQLRQRDFVATVIDAAARTEEAGCALDLEITESAIMQNVEAIVPKLQTIRGLGVEISIDDFGTGYSSLAYVARLPIHALKIDRSFVVGMTQSEDSLAIVRSVTSLAHSLRLAVIAEGVETREQEALLRNLACDLMQGYRISPPLPPERIRDFILARG
jgi:diguanylate cyclase (GGDEF)-like protein